MVRESGLEPLTFRLSGEHSYQLSYTRTIYFTALALPRMSHVEAAVIHPMKWLGPKPSRAALPPSPEIGSTVCAAAALTTHALLQAQRFVPPLIHKCLLGIHFVRSFIHDQCQPISRSCGVALQHLLSLAFDFATFNGAVRHTCS